MVIKLTTELAVREAAIDGDLLTTPAAVEAYLSGLKGALKEVFCVVALDTKNRAITKHLISLGTLDSTLVHPREVFKCALDSHAKSIILAHTHPSGDPTPSAEDIRVTKQLIGAGEIMGIKVLDHVILGTTSLSLRETGLCQFA
jgi:DNA repair protein RadC